MSIVSIRALIVEYFPFSLAQWGISPHRRGISSDLDSGSVFLKAKACCPGERLYRGFQSNNGGTALKVVAYSLGVLF